MTIDELGFVPLSPTGAELLFRLDSFPKGLFPAWAGEPSDHNALSVPVRVYPRVGGGTPFAAHTFWTMRGLSPRGRGNLFADALIAGLLGSIPAWAGEPSDHNALSVPVRVYPRVGGGTAESGSCPIDGSQYGVYPRVGGGTWTATTEGLTSIMGLSPRGRGNRHSRPTP